MSNFYFPKYKVSLIHIPKTAGWSIKTSGVLGPVSGAHFGVMPEQPYRFAFAIIRNPYARLASAWRMFYEGRSFCPRYKSSFKKFITITLDKNIPYDYVSSGRGLMTQIRHHTIPMTHPYNCLDKADHVGRFEELESFWGFISNKCGITAKLPHKNKSKPYDYMSLYDTTDLRRVNTFFEKDFNDLKYEFQINT